MCVATCCWANIGRVVYAVSEVRLGELTGEGCEENMTMAMPCKRGLEGSQKDVDVVGLLDGWAEEVVRESDEYWKPVRAAMAGSWPCLQPIILTRRMYMRSAGGVGKCSVDTVFILKASTKRSPSSVP